MNDSLPVYIEKYLKKFSLNNWQLELNNEGKYQLIIVVPALEEYKGIIELLNSIALNDAGYQKKTLLVFVINNKCNVPTETIENNKNSIKLIRDLILDGNGETSKLKNIPRINLGLVDTSSKGRELPEKDGGVGLARKIGMDLALRYFDYEKNNLLVCLDADCTVEKNYLEALFRTVENPKVKAGHVQYQHRMPENETQKLAIICYEIFLRYYVMGLKYAESPFAIHTIGSTMFCPPESYVKIQGMNKRKAAEDFYFMEKLSKIADIHVIEDTCIYPSNRPSWRVPFGTGQRVQRYLNQEQNEHMLYSFDSFRILKKWLEVFGSDEHADSEMLLKKAAEIDKGLHDFLIQQKFAEDWNKILKDTKNPEQIKKQKMFWFDGFRTLKLVHYLRDNGYPRGSMFDVLDEAFNEEGIPSITRNKEEEIPSIEIQMEYLKILRDRY